MYKIRLTSLPKKSTLSIISQPPNNIQKFAENIFHGPPLTKY